MEEPGEVRLPEEQVRALVVLAMQSTLPGVDLADATCGYVSKPPEQTPVSSPTRRRVG